MYPRTSVEHLLDAEAFHCTSPLRPVLLLPHFTDREMEALRVEFVSREGMGKLEIGTNSRLMPGQFSRLGAPPCGKIENCIWGHTGPSGFKNWLRFIHLL